MQLDLASYFSNKSMIRPEQIQGDLPTTKEMYVHTLSLAWPSTLERILVSLVGSLDTMMVGVLGSSAIAAIGMTQQPTFILLAIIFSLNVGVSAVIARRCGEKDFETANAVLRQSIMLIACLSTILAIIGFYFAPTILSLMGAEPEVLPLSVTYFRITLLGMVFNALTLNINAAQRGAGNTKIAMYTNIIATLVNLCLNFLLIEGRFGTPRLGIAGAAVATTAGYIVAFCIAFSSLVRPGTGILRLSLKGNWRIHIGHLKNILGVSNSALVEQLCMRAGFLLYTLIITSLGTAAYATHQICINIINLTFSLGDGIGIAASSLVGRQLGARRPDLSIIYGKITQRIGAILSSCLMVFFLLQRTWIVSLFTDEPSVITTGSIIMLIVAIVAPLQTLQVILSGSLRGAGDTKYIAFVSFVSVLIIRPVVAYVFCYPLGFGLIGAWCALLFDQTFRFIICYARFSKGNWTRIEV